MEIGPFGRFREWRAGESAGGNRAVITHDDHLALDASSLGLQGGAGLSRRSSGGRREGDADKAKRTRRRDRPPSTPRLAPVKEKTQSRPNPVCALVCGALLCRRSGLQALFCVALFCAGALLCALSCRRSFVRSLLQTLFYVLFIADALLCALFCRRTCSMASPKLRRSPV